MAGPQRPSASSGSGSSTSSHAAFAAVDSLVSKQVHGSDNTATWQSFNESQSSRSRGTGAAPILPVKRADRLGTGMQNRDDEKRHEDRIRREAGLVPSGSGYTAFKRSIDQDAVASAKRAKLVADRVRPDEKRYYIAAEAFGGWKEDYVFTTRDRGTGYYWDGMDSLKKQLGLSSGGPSSAVVAEETGAKDIGAGNDDGALPVDKATSKKKRKKKKKSKGNDADVGAHIEDDSNNPMDQISAAIRRRNQLMMHPPGSAGRAAAAAGLVDASAAAADAIGLMGSGLPSQVTALAAKGWEKAKDPSSGKEYYFNRKTGERSWDNPLLEKKEKPAEDGTTPSEGNLAKGWAATEDASTSKTYYYHAASGKTSWTRPE